jgi:hypothetical protein
MRSRSISEEFVIRTLIAPDRTFVGAQGNPIAEKTFGTAIIRVVYIDRLRPDGRYKHVITVMWK